MPFLVWSCNLRKKTLLQLQSLCHQMEAKLRSFPEKLIAEIKVAAKFCVLSGVTCILL